jgi:hypothetical protein
MSSHNEANRIRYADPVDPYEMLHTPWGHLPAWKAATIATGSMGVYETVRNDAVEAQAKLDEIAAREHAVTAREQAADARERALGVTAVRLRDEVGRVAAQWDKIEQARADQEREPLAAPPGAPGEISKQPEPSLPLADDTPAPGGELHSIRAKQNPEQDIEQDSRGEFLRLHNDQIEFPAGEQPILPPRPPVAAGLDQTT